MVSGKRASAAKDAGDGATTPTKSRKTGADTAPPPPASAAASGARCDLTALPSSLLKLTLAYASNGQYGRVYTAEQLYPTKPMSLLEIMPHLLAVSKAWYRAVVGIVDEFHAATHTIHIQTAQPDRLPAVYKALGTKDGNQIRDLRVVIRKPPREYYPPKRAKAHIEDGENLKIDWQWIFARCSALVRLDLSDVPLNSKHLWRIVDTASMHCHGLQALILPGDELYDHEPRKPDFPAIMSSVFQALKRWHQYQGSSGGLRQLFVSKRHIREEDKASDIVHPDKFLDHVARFCPNIEYLTSWKTPDSGSFNVNGDNPWLCSLDEWHNFCRTCTQLREFYWLHVPLDDTLLAIFAAYPKLNLKKMVFAEGTYFINQDAERDFVSKEFHHQGELRTTSSGMVNAITACPALEELHFWIGGGEFYRSQVLQDETNDDVLHAVAANCLALRKLIIYHGPCEVPGDPMEDITDAGLIAISTLPKLEHIALKPTNAAAVGILALIQNASDPQRKRRVILELGHCESDICFFEELEKFMRLLVRSPAESLRGCRFELELRILSFIDVTKATRRTIISLANQVRVRHQNVAVLYNSYLGNGASEPPKDIEVLESVIFISPRDMARHRKSSFEAWE